MSKEAGFRSYSKTYYVTISSDWKKPTSMMMLFLSENAVPLWMWCLWAREKHNQLAELIPFQPDKHIHLYLGRIQLAPCLFQSRYVVWGSSQTKLPSQSIVNVPKTRDLCPCAILTRRWCHSLDCWSSFCWAWSTANAAASTLEIGGRLGIREEIQSKNAERWMIGDDLLKRIVLTELKFQAYPQYHERHELATKLLTLV